MLLTSIRNVGNEERLTSKDVGLFLCPERRKAQVEVRRQPAEKTAASPMDPADQCPSMRRSAMNEDKRPRQLLDMSEEGDEAAIHELWIVYGIDYANEGGRYE